MKYIHTIIVAAMAATAFTSYPAMADTFDGPYVGVNAGWSRTEIDSSLEGFAIDDELTQEAASFGESIRTRSKHFIILQSSTVSEHFKLCITDTKLCGVLPRDTS